MQKMKTLDNYTQTSVALRSSALLREVVTLQLSVVLDGASDKEREVQLQLLQKDDRKHQADQGQSKSGRQGHELRESVCFSVF